MWVDGTQSNGGSGERRFGHSPAFELPGIDMPLEGEPGLMRKCRRGLAGKDVENQIRDLGPLAFETLHPAADDARSEIGRIRRIDGSRGRLGHFGGDFCVEGSARDILEDACQHHNRVARKARDLFQQFGVGKADQGFRLILLKEGAESFRRSPRAVAWRSRSEAPAMMTNDFASG